MGTHWGSPLLTCSCSPRQWVPTEVLPCSHVVNHRGNGYFWGSPVLTCSCSPRQWVPTEVLSCSHVVVHPGNGYPLRFCLDAIDFLQELLIGAVEVHVDEDVVEQVAESLLHLPPLLYHLLQLLVLPHTHTHKKQQIRFNLVTLDSRFKSKLQRTLLFIINASNENASSISCPFSITSFSCLSCRTYTHTHTNCLAPPQSPPFFLLL